MMPPVFQSDMTRHNLIQQAAPLCISEIIMLR